MRRYSLFTYLVISVVVLGTAIGISLYVDKYRKAQDKLGVIDSLYLWSQILTDSDKREARARYYERMAKHHPTADSIDRNLYEKRVSCGGESVLYLANPWIVRAEHVGSGMPKNITLSNKENGDIRSSKHGVKSEGVCEFPNRILVEVPLLQEKIMQYMEKESRHNRL